MITEAFREKYFRYGWEGVWTAAKKKGYSRSLSGMVYTAKRLGLEMPVKKKKLSRRSRRYPELMEPGEKVQIEVNEAP